MLLERLHNPRGQVCGCDPDCWCQRTAVGRAVKWWFPARYLGIQHRHDGPNAQWKRDQAAQANTVRAPQAVLEVAAHRVSRLVPFVSVANVRRSVDFYAQLGFVIRSIFGPEESPTWASLEGDGGAELMFEHGDPVDARRQGVQFYLYSHDLEALRAQLIAAGIAVSPIEDGSPGPYEEMRVVDPDGYLLMVAQIDTA